MSEHDSITVVPVEIQKIICECLLDDATASLQQLSDTDEPDEIEKNASSFEQAVTDLTNLGRASKYWRVIVRPTSSQIRYIILNKYLNVAPWQVADSKDVEETQASTRRLRRQTLFGGPPLIDASDREKQKHLYPYLNSLCKLPPKFRPWAVKKTSPSKPFIVLPSPNPTPPEFHEASRHWAWLKTPVAREILVPAMTMEDLDMPWFLRPQSNLNAIWVENGAYPETLDEILPSLWKNFPWALVMLLKAMNTGAVRLERDSYNGSLIVSKWTLARRRKEQQEMERNWKKTKMPRKPRLFRTT
ncbi:uncharacterized protein KY384_000790 [Bacidia gigantensis]|uniref:uncharacterized protein n=1 Tax=Bacidia gigantensis TaxID=2732470 RepID=UPI001D040CFA|nr:uncharacterized protein KY384_000790 [Bacidia gigantensis]KAG8526028.1 hypothetical protein KY384_000790 [Bacidia gigantensis]